MHLEWHKLIPVDRHVEFRGKEDVYCQAELKAFYAAYAANDDDVEERRRAVLNKREEFLLNFLEHEL